MRPYPVVSDLAGKVNLRLHTSHNDCHVAYEKALT